MSTKGSRKASPNKFQKSKIQKPPPPKPKVQRPQLAQLKLEYLEPQKSKAPFSPARYSTRSHDHDKKTPLSPEIIGSLDSPPFANLRERPIRPLPTELDSSLHSKHQKLLSLGQYEPQYAETSTQTFPTKHVYNDRLDRRLLVPGVVISTPIYEPDYNLANDTGFQQRKILTDLGPVHSKPRKLVILRRFDLHCVAVPIYSFHEQGLTLKKVGNKDDYVGIQDSQLPRPPSQSQYPPLVFTRAPQFSHFTRGFHVMSPSSYVFHIFPVSYRYVYNGILEGKISDTSLRQLIGLYNSRAPQFPPDSDPVNHTPAPSLPPPPGCNHRKKHWRMRK